MPPPAFCLGFGPNCRPSPQWFRLSNNNETKQVWLLSWLYYLNARVDILENMVAVAGMVMTVVKLSRQSKTRLETWWALQLHFANFLQGLVARNPCSFCTSHSHSIHTMVVMKRNHSIGPFPISGLPGLVAISQNSYSVACRLCGLPFVVPLRLGPVGKGCWAGNWFRMMPWWYHIITTGVLH